VRDDLPAQLAGAGALVDPARRALFLHVCAQPVLVSREQAARAVGVPLHTAKFHLDRLVDEGLLEVEFRRLSGRTGPGAGRPAKLYRRSARQLEVSLPERHYDLAGAVLAAAVQRSLHAGTPVADAVAEESAAAGRRLAAEPAERGVHDRADVTRVAAVLARHGYEPRPAPDGLELANCPFDRLATEHTSLVCGMNVDLVQGVLAGLGTTGLVAVLEPRPGACCVRVRAAPGAG
jgi:predicted ArsR family transcriptional regulator